MSEQVKRVRRRHVDRIEHREPSQALLLLCASVIRIQSPCSQKLNTLQVWPRSNNLIHLLYCIQN